MGKKQKLWMRYFSDAELVTAVCFLTSGSTCRRKILWFSCYLFQSYLLLSFEYTGCLWQIPKCKHIKLNYSNTTQEWKLEINLIFSFPLIFSLSLFSLHFFFPFASWSTNGKIERRTWKSLAIRSLEENWKQILMKIAIVSFTFLNNGNKNKLKQSLS